MTELASWGLRGPVRTLRTDIAEWDRDRGEWKESRQYAYVTFRNNGRITSHDHHNSDGTIARTARVFDPNDRLIEETHFVDDGARTTRVYSYDDAGRCVDATEIRPDGNRRIFERYRYDRGAKSKIVFLEPVLGNVPMMYGSEGSIYSYPAPAAVTQTTRYDHRDLPERVTYHNSADEEVLSIEFTRDEDGRVLVEEVTSGGASAFPMVPLEEIPIEGRESVKAMLDAIMPDRSFASVGYEYDARGRLIARTRRFMVLSQERTTFTYDDHDNPVLEKSENNVMKAGFDRSGHLQTEPDAIRHHEVRFDYRYDEHGNWIERVVSGRTEPSEPFQRSNVEWRTIEYH